MVDIVTMGELLVDFVPLHKGLSLKENEGFLRAAGGAPANVAVGAAKLGSKAAFLGKVGADPFGDFLVDTLAKEGVETKFIVRSREAKTCLAFVILDEKGERDFIFYRDPSADMLYSWEEFPQEIFQTSKVFHYGSISLGNEPIREATLKGAELARKNGLIVSYDPNLRKPLWPGEEEARRWILEGLKRAQLVKISEEELEFITGEKDLEKGCQKVFTYGPELILVTLGAEGSYYHNSQVSGLVPGYQVETADTTGAGDSFVAAILSQLVKKGISHLGELSKEELEAMLSLANAVGALTTTQKGAIAAMPELAKVNEFLNDRK